MRTALADYNALMKNHFWHRWGGRSRCPLTAVLLAMAAFWLAALIPVPAPAGSEPAPVARHQPPATAPPSRDAVWRTIFARPPAAASNTVDEAKIALGRELFHDARLSGAGHASCATCHNPEHAFTDGRKTAVGADGSVLSRNAPALYDLAWASSFFWDGRATTLEEQARVPILAPNELAGDFALIGERLSSDPVMAERFASAFPSAPVANEANVLAALAAYERSLASPETRFDKWVQGDDAALSDREREGFAIFVGKGGCVSWHGGWRLTDDAFHDVGLPGKDMGRGALLKDAAGLPEFKTPSLREAAHTAPYMHDGSLATLEDVVDHYSGGLVMRPSLAPTLVRDLKLTETEKASLVAFLKALSSEQKSHTQDGTTRPMLKK